jgi:parvulin-like peptidyl-prolyl isomerase
MSKSSKTRRSSKQTDASQPKRQTKKQIAIGRRESRQNRIIWLIVGIVAAIAVGILLVGIISEVVVKPRTPVATVNGSKISTVDHDALATYRRSTLEGNIQELQNGLQSLDSSDENSQFLIAYYQQQLEQLQFALGAVDEAALEELIEDELISEKAQEANLSVTAAEIDQTIREDLVRIAAPAPQTPITGTEVIPTPTPIPQKELDDLYQLVLESLGVSDRDFHSIIGRSLLRGKVHELLSDEVPTTGLVANVQLIQTDTEEQSQVALERIEAGEDFAVVAQEVSTDTLTAEVGGDLGWVTPPQMASRYGEDLQKQVFSSSAGQIHLVSSNDQWFVVMVVEIDEDGDLPLEVVVERQDNALSDWLTERKGSPDVEIERMLQ